MTASKYANRVIIVAGPPASGKGTQCKILADKLGMIHVSTGDVFRDAVTQSTELGLQAKQYLDAGSFVPDEMVTAFVKTRLQQPDVRAHGCLLDGFPRTPAQAEALAREVDAMLFLVLMVPDQALVARAAQRRIDPASGKIYHLEFNPPPAELIPSLVRRDYDDDERTFNVRLSTFRELIRRIAPYFPCKVRTVDGMRAVGEVSADMERAIVEAAADPTPATRQASAGSGAGACAICLTEPADFLCSPCGHQCGCEGCLKRVRNCPICRAPIQNLQRVFKAGVGDESDVLTPLRPSDAVVAPLEPLRLDGGAREPLDDDAWPEDAEEAISPTDAAAAMGVSLEVVPAAPITDEGGTVPVVVRVGIADDLPQARAPVDLCCVVDISGSMGNKAEYEDANGNVTNDGLSILDVVKHAVKTVAHILGEGDRLSLVVFDDVAEVSFPLRLMDAG